MVGVLLITPLFGWLEVEWGGGGADAAQCTAQRCLAPENQSLYLEFILTDTESNTDARMVI